MKRVFVIKLFILLFLFLVIPLNAVAQEGATILESHPAPEIIPLYDIDCPMNNMAYGGPGRNMFDVIYSFDSCYQNFLNQGMDESICGKFSKDEQTWSTNLEYKTNACFLGFAIANEDYTICNEIKFKANYQNVYIDLPTCYIYTSIISREIKPCTLLEGKDKNNCFESFGPSVNLTWVLWFLPKVILYILISLILFIVMQFFINSK